MAYANQDFGEAAPPDAGGHLGVRTTPDQLFDARRVDASFAVPASPVTAPRPQSVSLTAVSFSLLVLLSLLLVPSFIW